MTKQSRILPISSGLLRSLCSLAMTMFILLFATPALACTNPVGVAGDMTYNDTEEVMQWCDGTNWNGVNTPPYIPNGVYFDGVNDYLNSGPLTGAGLSRQATVSAWFRRSTATPSSTIVRIQNTLKLEYQSSSDEIRISDANTALIYDLRTNNFNDNIGDWNHILISFDLNNPANRHIYLNDVSDINPVLYTAADLDFNFSLGVGGRSNGAEKWLGDIADLWVDFDTYLDLSDVNIRRKFIDANGWPVDLGADGSRPTGSSPDIFLSGDTAAWHTNDGTGGGFTENGALTDASTHPGEEFGPMDGLIGWWKLDETAGTTAFDSSGNGHDATYNNPFSGNTFANTSVNGIIGRAVELNSNNDCIVVSDPAFAPGSNTITITGWFKPYIRATSPRIFDIGDAILSFNGSRIRLTHSGGFDDDNSVWDVDRWHYITLTYDGATALSYLNAALRLTTPATITLDGNIGMGCQYLPGIEFQGQMDDVRFYDRVLSPAEVQELYDTGFPCKNPEAQRSGDIAYNTTHHVPQYCNNREWRAMGAGPGDGGAGCSNPTGEAGDFNYETNNNVMTYCEGDEWRALAY